MGATSRPQPAFVSFVRETSGFSLAELLIAVVIIGVLALLALPRFLTVATRAKQTEAKLALRTLHTLQQAHRYEYDRYAEDTARIGFEQEPSVEEGGTSRYRVRIESAEGSRYVAVAEAVVDSGRSLCRAQSKCPPLG